MRCTKLDSHGRVGGAAAEAPCELEALEGRLLLSADFVIHISVDGLRPDAVTALGAEELPAFYRLRAEGAFTDNARTDYNSTVTVPGHASQLTGRPVAGSDGHGITFDTDPGTTVHDAAGFYVASAFDVVHDHGLSTAMYASKSKFAFFDRSWDADHGAPDLIAADNGPDKIDTFLYVSDTGDLTDAFVADMASDPYAYSFMHWADPDRIGHVSGWMSSQYLDAVRHVDLMLGQVLDMIETDPVLAGRTAVILTADHGGTGTGHGSTSDPRNYTVPLYVWGPSVTPGGDLYLMNPTSRQDPAGSRLDNAADPQPIREADVANLALDLLGLGPVPGSVFNAARDLSVDTPVQQVQTARFQQGADGYSGTVDAVLRQGDPDTSFAAEIDLNVDGDYPSGSGMAAQVLMRFEGIFGSGAGLVPAGATIVSASLLLQVSSPGDSLKLHRMLRGWSDTDTWNSLAGGISPDGAEAAANADVASGSVDDGLVSINVTASLRAWQADPLANLGWAILPSGPDGVRWGSAEAASPPQLVVNFVPEPPNHAPEAVDDSYVVRPGTPLDVPAAAGLLANDRDLDGDALTVAVVDGPSHGRLTGSLADFTVAVIGDTQFYSQSYPDIYTAQTQWIADHVQSDNIVLVTHLGDFVQDDDEVELEWQRADAAMSLLDGVVPYGLLPGNHDLAPGGASVLYSQYFPASRYEANAWWGGSYSANRNNYQLVSAGGDDYLFLHLEHSPPDDVIAWANGVLADHPDRKAVLSVHQYLDNAGQRVTTTIANKLGDNSGEDIWQKVVLPNDNVVLVLGGHEPGVSRRSDVIGDRTVHQVRHSFQDWSNGGDGYFRMMTFHPAGGTVSVTTYSPTLDAYVTDDGNQFELAWPMTGGDGSFTYTPDEGFTGTDSFTYRLTDASGASSLATVYLTVADPAEVVGRHVFYNHSAWDGDDPAAEPEDDDAIAPDKQALRPGQSAGFANYTSYSRGLNGVMVDIAAALRPGDIGLGDFEFRVGNDAHPAGWAPPAVLPAVSVREGAGGSTRVTLTWPDNAIAAQWLQVTVKATPATNLDAPDVFYFGNAIGESGNESGSANVDSGDRLGARSNPRGAFNPAPIDFPYDFNRDRLVDSGDRLIARANATSTFTRLALITAPPASPPSASPDAAGESAGGADGGSLGLAPSGSKTGTGTSAANGAPLRSQSPFSSPAFLIAPLLDAIQVAAPTWVPSLPQPLAQSSAQTRPDAAAVADEPWPSADDQPPATIDILAAPRLAVL